MRVRKPNRRLHLPRRMRKMMTNRNQKTKIIMEVNKLHLKKKFNNNQILTFSATKYIPIVFQNTAEEFTYELVSILINISVK